MKPADPIAEDGIVPRSIRPYPDENPTCYHVTFEVTLENDRTRVFTGKVRFSELPDEYEDSDVMQAAWEKEAEKVNRWAEEAGSKTPLIDQPFTPTT